MELVINNIFFPEVQILYDGKEWGYETFWVKLISIPHLVAALIELSKFRLPTITITLLNLLDSIKVQTLQKHL